MRDYVKNLADREGWRDETTVEILCRTLDAIVGMGIDRTDLEAIVRREAGLDGSLPDNDPPECGDVVHMRKQDVRIVVEEVPDDQPESVDGIWTIIDEDGDTHRIERENADEPWYAVIPAI